METCRLLALASTILAGVVAPLGAQVAEPSTIQAVYAVPSDVVPVSGRLAASAENISVVQDWFAGQAGGNYPVFNETSGAVDVQLLILSKTKAEVEALTRNGLSTLLTTESTFGCVRAGTARCHSDCNGATAVRIAPR